MADIIDRIDTGLDAYYAQLGRDDYKTNGVGKFRTFCDDNGLDAPAVKEELAEEECILVEFDVDENDTNLFPLQPPYDEDIGDNDDARAQHIKSILVSIAEQVDDPKITFNLEMCANISSQEINRTMDKYKAQMGCFADDMKTDKDVMWALAVGERNNIPFLTYMIDSYTRDKAQYHADTHETLSVGKWAKSTAFMRGLQEKYPNERLDEKLESAMKTYSKRIMQRLQFEKPTFKVNDNMAQICEYVASMPVVIKNLMDRQMAAPPFQVELMVHVNTVDAHVIADNDDYDEYDDELEQKLDPQANHIGAIRKNLSEYPASHFCLDMSRLNPEKTQKRHVVARLLVEGYRDFTTTLTELKAKTESYPQNKRFCIMVDRAQNSKSNSDEQKGKDKDSVQDEITFFEPPAYCNTIENDHVPEIGFELIRKCIMPIKDAKGKDVSITANDRICGQLMTFMFNVEKRDEIKCYLVWNGQTMRFNGDNMINVLPKLFADSDQNTEFIRKGKRLDAFKDMFNEEMEDEKFNVFYRTLRTFK
eukprot:58011_1